MVPRIASRGAVTTVALILCCMSAAVAAPSGADVGEAVTAEGSSESDGLSALHVRYRMPGEHELARATIELSPSHGLRVRQTGQGAGAWEMIESFADGEAWLLDRDRGVALQLATPGKIAAETNVPAPEASPSFLGDEPCAGDLVPPPRQGKWRNRPVYVYECPASDTSDAGAESVEFVDVQFGIVSYRRDASGRVDELRDMRARRFSERLFRPGTDLRYVDPGEFFDGKPRIGSYVER